MNISRHDDVVMIGEREHDIIGAKETGIESIGVLYGYGSMEELNNAGATWIAESVGDLMEMLTQDNSADGEKCMVHKSLI